MEEIIVRENKKIIMLMRGLAIFWCILFFFIFIDQEEPYTVLNVFLFLFMLILGIVFGSMYELAYRFRYLKLGTKECCYSTMFNRKRHFLLNDIAAIYPKFLYGSEQGYEIIGNDHTVFARFEKNMEHAEMVIPFLERQKELGNWSGKILKEYEALEYMAISDVMIVRPSKKCLIQPIVISFVTLMCVCGIIYGFLGILGVIHNGDSYGFILGISMCMTTWCGIFSLTECLQEFSRYKNWYLKLTPNMCLYRDQRGKEIQFSIDDIKDASRKSELRGNRTYLHMIVRGIKNPIVVFYDDDNAELIQKFLRYHKHYADTK